MDTIIPQKCCITCKQYLPLSSFGSHKRSRDGLQSQCRNCWREYMRKRRESPKVSPPPELVCTACGEKKPATLEFFRKSPYSSHGLFMRCKKCVNAHAKNYYQTHPEIRRKQIQYSAQYRKAHPEKVHLWRKITRIRTREKRSAYNKHYGQTHRTQRNERQRQQRASNPERRRMQERQYKQREDVKMRLWHYRRQKRIHDQRLAATRNRRARKRAIPGMHTPQDIQNQYARQKGKCYWCGVKLNGHERMYHVDHIIPLTREGSSNDPWNLVIACPFCNVSRNNKLPHEWPDGGHLL